MTPQGGQASDQASKRAPGRHRSLHPDTSLERHPRRGSSLAESRAKSTRTNLTTAQTGPPHSQSSHLSRSVGDGFNLPQGVVDVNVVGDWNDPEDAEAPTVARAVDASDARFGGCPRVRRVNFRGWASTVVGRAAAVGSQPSDTPDERLRKSALVLSSLLITILSFVWVGTYAVLGLWRSALIPFAYQVASLVGLVFLARTKRYAAYRASQVAMFLVLPFLLQWGLGGFVQSGAVALWAFVAPLGALVFYGRRRAIGWVV